MTIRIPAFLLMAVSAVLLADISLFAETWSVKPRPSREKRLARELDLLLHCDCDFKGVCRNGKSVFAVPAEKANTIRTMSVHMDMNVPEVGLKATRLLISYSRASGKPAEATLREAGLKTIEDYERGSFLLVEPQAVINAAAVRTLLDDDAVLHVAPDYVVSATPADANSAAGKRVVPNDPLAGQLWGMECIGATRAWPVIHDSPQIIIAVIDTGVDYRHPDLKASMWSRGGRYGHDFFDDDDDPLDEEGHGTHCAGTIAAAGNNGVGVVGVSWKAQIMAMRFMGPDGSGATSDAVKCIDWAVANGAHILSNSWAGPDTSPELAEAITRAEQRGVLFVAAAGNTADRGNDNDTTPYFPASLPNGNILSVAAIDSGDARASFSHYGRTSVDLGAPGVGIISTYRNNQYVRQDGTSMAAPHVAGAAALVWSRAFSTPEQDRAQMLKVRDLLLEHARPVPSLRELWGHSPTARVPGGVLDISFLEGNASGAGTPSRRSAYEFRIKVDPEKLQRE